MTPQTPLCLIFSTQFPIFAPCNPYFKRLMVKLVRPYRSMMRTRTQALRRAYALSLLDAAPSPSPSDLSPADADDAKKSRSKSKK